MCFIMGMFLRSRNCWVDIGYLAQYYLPGWSDFDFDCAVSYVHQKIRIRLQSERHAPLVSLFFTPLVSACQIFPKRGLEGMTLFP